MSDTSELLTPAQRNARLVTRQIAMTFDRHDPATDKDEYDTAERDLLRTLGKTVIDADAVLSDEDMAFWLTYPAVARLVRSFRALRDAADRTYEWHVGFPVPTPAEDEAGDGDE